MMKNTHHEIVIFRQEKEKINLLSLDGKTNEFHNMTFRQPLLTTSFSSSSSCAPLGFQLVLWSTVFQQPLSTLPRKSNIAMKKKTTTEYYVWGLVLKTFSRSFRRCLFQFDRSFPSFWVWFHLFQKISDQYSWREVVMTRTYCPIFGTCHLSFDTCSFLSMTLEPALESTISVMSIHLRKLSSFVRLVHIKWFHQHRYRGQLVVRFLSLQRSSSSLDTYDIYDIYDTYDTYDIYDIYKEKRWTFTYPKNHQYWRVAMKGRFTKDQILGKDSFLVNTEQVGTTKDAVQLYLQMSMCVRVTDQYYLWNQYIDGDEKNQEYNNKSYEKKIENFLILGRLWDDESSLRSFSALQWIHHVLISYVDQTFCGHGNTLTRITSFLTKQPSLANYIWKANFSLPEQRKSLAFAMNLSSKYISGFIQCSSLKELEDWLDRKRYPPYYNKQHSPKYK